MASCPAGTEAIFVTPSHHRVHHASNVRYLDRNMGQVLIIWDKLFGTFQEEQEDDKPVFGLTKPLNTNNPVKAIFHEHIKIWNDMKKPVGLLTRIRYIFALRDGAMTEARRLRNS